MPHNMVKKKRKKITVMGQIPWFLRENRKEKGKEGGKEGEGGMGGRKEGKRQRGKKKKLLKIEALGGSIREKNTRQLLFIKLDSGDNLILKIIELYTKNRLNFGDVNFTSLKLLIVIT